MSSGDAQDKKKKKRGKYGQGSIRKKENGKYEYRFRYTDIYGERRCKTLTANSVGECLDMADVFMYKVNRLRGGFNSDATIPEILYWKIDSDYAKNYTGEAGYDRNRYTIAIIEKSPLGKLPIAQIIPEQVNDFMASMTHYSNTMLQKIHRMLKMAFRIAFDTRLIEINFMTRDDLRCPKSDKPDRRVRGMTESEQARFVKSLMEHKVPYGRESYKLQLLIELYSGMRMGEINALRPKDIDFENGFIHVKSTVCRGINYRAYVRQGAKTDAGTREVPISNLLRPLLQQALDEMKKNPEGLIFYDYHNKKVVETARVNNFFSRICKKAGIEHCGQHSLRHTFATRCIEAGISPLVLKTWLGHTNIHITLDTYSDVFSRLNAGSISLLEKHVESLMPKDVTEQEILELETMED